MRTKSACLGFVLAACSIAPAAAPNPPDDAWTSVTIPNARQVDVAATGTGHRYRIAVVTPPGPVPERGYPVLYVLDGNTATPVAALLARTVAGRRGVTGYVAPLVIGIGYPDEGDDRFAARRRDYTPGTGAPQATAAEGGATLFLDFLEQDLKPMIAAHFRIDPARQAIFGHSFGGLLVLHALLNRPAAFTTYLASSPSIWWQDESVLAPLTDLARSAQSIPARVQITVGGLEDDPPAGKRSPETLALLAKRKMIAPARRASTQLRELPGGHANVVFHVLAGEDHGTVWLPALARGMQYFVEQPLPAGPSH